MRDNDIKSAITELLHKHKTDPLTESQIAATLRLKGKTRKQLQKWLRELVIAGAIVRLRKNRYGIGTEADLITGTLSLVRSGNAFLALDSGGPDIFVPHEDTSTALPGDRVLVRLAPERPSGADQRPTGVVIRIEERQRRDIVGTLKSTGTFLSVTPMDPRYRKDFYVPDAGGANVGDRVVVRFVNWQSRNVNPEGKIIESLGPADKPTVDTISVIRHFGFSETFPADALADAERVAARLDRPGQREDIRKTLTITIDPERARDFDDALSLETTAKGTRILGVHIADVSHFIRPGSALDKEAQRRGNSVYFPDAVLPMLPEQLSNGVCSLRPDEDRLAFSAFLTLDKNGRVTASRFARTRIRSDCRLSYKQAFRILQGKPVKGKVVATPVPGLLKKLHHLAQQFRQRRFARHALDLDMPEFEIVMNKKGMIEALRPVVNDISHQLVEECMVAANEAVARELKDRQMPALYRIHDAPTPDRLEELGAQLHSLGLQPGNLSQAQSISTLLTSVKDHPLAYHVRLAILRSMKRAVYALDGKGHYGLAKRFYTHFTSPIRRYPDLVVHRQLASLLTRPTAQASTTKPPRSGWGKIYGKDELVGIAAACCRTEREADEAEKALVEIKKYRYLEQELKRGNLEPHPATVVRVTNFGLFVELGDLQIQGLVHMSSLSNEFVRYDAKKGRLHARRRTYGVGDRLEVIVVRVDMDGRKVDFAPVGKKRKV